MLLFPGAAGIDDRTPVGQLTVLCLQNLFCDEMHRRIVVGEIVRHLLDFFLNPRRICALPGDDPAFTCMLLAGGQIRIQTCPDLVKRILNRDSILARVLYAFDPADRVGMSLRDAATPERIVTPVWKNRMRIEPAEREHPRIPSAGNDPDFPS